MRKPYLLDGDCEHCRIRKAQTTTVWHNPETRKNESIRVCRYCEELIAYCNEHGVRMNPKRFDKDSVYHCIRDPLAENVSLLKSKNSTSSNMNPVDPNGSADEEEMR